MKNVLISGASIAGPALAYWLHRHGFEVTVVERSAAVRGGGYPIDLRGAAVDVVERMGLLEQVEAARTDTRHITFLDQRLRRLVSLHPESIAGMPGERAVELPRGDLTSLLYERTRDDVEYVFVDSITAIDQDADGVRVRFEQGEPRTFDLVVGADGIHSNVRGQVFGPEADFRRDLGYSYAGFGVENTMGLDREGLIHNTPGRMATLYAVRDQPQVTALLAFATPPADLHRDVEGQRRLVERAYAGSGWVVPQLLAAMRTAPDFYFDSVSQIRMQSWTDGRVALVGDAAYAPSFMSGQGTSLAVVGAYVLAGELAAAGGDHRVALPAYEAAMRPFAERNQRLVDRGQGLIIPIGRRQLWLRNQLMRLTPLLTRLGVRDRSTAQAATAITLREHAHVAA